MAKKKKTMVLWDYENASVPHDLPPELAYEHILEGLRQRGFNGPVQITLVVAYQNSYVPKELEQHEGIDVVRVNDFDRPENSAKNQISDTEIKERVRAWMASKPEPHNFMLITGDNGFKDILGELEASGHTTMIALCKNQSLTDTSTKLKLENRWDWRLFLDLPEKSVNKKTRDAEFVKGKIDEAKKKEEAEKDKEEEAEESEKKSGKKKKSEKKSGKEDERAKKKMKLT